MPNLIAGPALHLLERQTPFRESGAIGPFDLQLPVQDKHILGDVVENVTPDIGAYRFLLYFFHGFTLDNGITL
jgi:hypothetical protein